MTFSRSFGIGYTEYQADAQIQRGNRTAAVAEKGERNADNGEQAQIHTQIDEGLKTNECHHTYAQVGSQ